MSVPLRLCFAVLFLAAVEAHEGTVSFWKMSFTMTCPEGGKWFQESKEMGLDETGTLTLEYKDKGKYHCEYDAESNKKSYYFYVRGKVCENCFELDASLYTAIIAGDMGLTLVVMAIVYKCTKKRRSAGLPHPPKASSHPGGRAPPVPSPDYEQLNPHTLSQGTYSEVHNSRMG